MNHHAKALGINGKLKRSNLLISFFDTKLKLKYICILPNRIIIKIENNDPNIDERRTPSIPKRKIITKKIFSKAFNTANKNPVKANNFTFPMPRTKFRKKLFSALNPSSNPNSGPKLKDKNGEITIDKIRPRRTPINDTTNPLVNKVVGFSLESMAYLKIASKILKVTTGVIIATVFVIKSTVPN